MRWYFNNPQRRSEKQCTIKCQAKLNIHSPISISSTSAVPSWTEATRGLQKQTPTVVEISLSFALSISNFEIPLRSRLPPASETRTSFLSTQQPQQLVRAYWTVNTSTGRILIQCRWLLVTLGYWLGGWNSLDSVPTTPPSTNHQQLTEK